MFPGNFSQASKMIGGNRRKHSSNSTTGTHTTSNRAPTRPTNGTLPVGNGGILSTVVLLYCVIFLLTIITVLLLVILLKKYCKKCKGSRPDSNIEGGTFRMSDLKCNSALDQPNNNVASHLNDFQSYTASDDDSSSTSSGSLCPSHKEKQNNNNQQYMSFKTSLQSPDYENIPEGKSTSAVNYEKKKRKKNRDYVNVEEEQNMPLTKDKIGKRERHQGDEDESQTSSESSSDESSDDNSVDYTTVVFIENSNAVQREQ